MVRFNYTQLALSDEDLTECVRKDAAMDMDEPVIGTPSGASQPEPSEEAGDATQSAQATSKAAGDALRPGAAVQVAYAGASRGPAFNSSVMGVEPEALALDLSREGRIPQNPADAEPLVLVVRGKEQLHAFDSKVIGVEAKRALLLVAPPVEARRPERRVNLRASVGVPLRSGVWLDPKGGEYPIQGATVVDVSVGGLQLRSLRYVGEGALVRLAFVLHPSERPVHVQGMVVGVREEERSTALRIHVQFVEMPDDSREQITRFVDRSASRRRVA